MVTATRAAGEQVRSLLRSPQMTRQQLDQYKSSCRLVGDPEPSGYHNGQPFWATSAVVDWAAGAKRSRSGLVGTQQRGMVATLLRRGTETQDKQRASADELLADIASDDKKTPAAAEKQILASGFTVDGLAPQLRTIESRKRAVADRQRAGDASSEAERLQGEIDLAETEIEEWLLPRHQKIQDLHDEKTAATRRSTDLTTAKTLRDSAPQWLQTAEGSARSMISDSVQREKYLATMIRYSQGNIDGAEDELKTLPGRITLLAARVSDFEGQQEAKKLENKKTELESLIARSKTEMAAHAKEQSEIEKRIQSLQQRLSRIAELMLEVWPSPADLAD